MAARRPAFEVALGASAIGVTTHESPAMAGRAYTEAYLTQPVLMGHAMALGGHLGLLATIDLEGATLARGELTPGIYGEGYHDRRHPHTYSHEIVASAESALWPRARVSVAAGKGFAPFGTDDPMMRPFEKYPANHHLAQILERWVAMAAARIGPVIAEAGTFDGDEPVRPWAWPRISRFGNSYAGRLTLVPAPAIELQGSAASVISPEVAPGGGLDQRKLSASARYEAALAPGTRRYALLEWEQTDEVSHGVRAFRYQSVLAEAFGQRRGIGAGLRYERTTRPEEERLANPFRTPVPPSDANIIGITQWTTVTAALSADPWYARRVSVAPFLEIGRATPRAVLRPTGFDPLSVYGNSRIWIVSVGARLRLGDTMHRMGRYGVAASDLHHGAPESTMHMPM